MYSNTFVAFLLVVVSCCLTNFVNSTSRHKRIIHGQDAVEGQFPCQVSLRTHYPDKHYCGGSIIHHSWILTAAHCFKGINNYYVATGTIYINTGDKYNVLREVPHPLYSNVGHYDIGLIQTKTLIKFSATVQPIKLQKVSFNEGENAVAVGWGLSNYSLPASPLILKWLTTKIISRSTCQRSFGTLYTIQPSQVCAITSPGGVCLGDSGGPLLKNGIQIGVISKIIPCARGYPDIFTDVTKALSWIYEYVHL